MKSYFIQNHFSELMHARVGHSTVGHLGGVVGLIREKLFRKSSRKLNINKSTGINRTPQIDLGGRKYGFFISKLTLSIAKTRSKLTVLLHKNELKL